MSEQRRQESKSLMDPDIIFCEVRIWLGRDKRQGIEIARGVLKVYERDLDARDKDTKPSAAAKRAERETA